MNLKKLILVDGNAIVHRAYHAMPPFRTQKGELVNAVYGFASMLLNILRKERPDYIAVSFDTKAKTFRHEEYKEYKATRVKGPDELYFQFPRVKELVRAFNIPIFELDGFEADDVLGTLAHQADKTKEVHTYIMTGDQDTLQLITGRTSILYPVKGFGETMIYDVPRVLAKFGISPTQIPDFKGLKGDASDNIHGVKGIGEKTAITLLQKYGTLENIYENLEKITGAIHNKLADDKDAAFFSKKMATIVCDVPVTLDLPSCHTHDYDKNAVTALFSELEFHSLLKKLNDFQSIGASNLPRAQLKNSTPQNQGTLF